MLVLNEKEKSKNPWKNLLEQSREPTNSTHKWVTVEEGEGSHLCANTASCMYFASSF